MKRAALCLLAFGCASAPTSGTMSPTSHPASVMGDETVLVRLSEEPDAMASVIKATPEKVWALLPEVYGRLEIAGQVLDSENRIYGTRKFTNTRLAGTRTGDFVRCGEEGAGQSLGSMYRRNLSIVSTVRGNPDGRTIVSTEITGYAQPVEGTSTEAMRCASNGRLEKRIRTVLNELIAAETH